MGFSRGLATVLGSVELWSYQVSRSYPRMNDSWAGLIIIVWLANCLTMKASLITSLVYQQILLKKVLVKRKEHPREK